MDPDRFRRVKELFQAALALEPERRSGYLASACGEDGELCDEVERLLAMDGESEGFLNTPDLTGAAPGWSDDSLVGKRIGSCKLVRVLSSGGMGTVYEALQEQPRRTVAVKVMRQGVTSRSSLRRFEYEAQVMAGLNHPHIASVIEAGTCEEGEAAGLPYLVIEYVPEARSITEYVQRTGLSVKERLDLFLQVCEAVHYGHGKGVIHRDLKPSNILVDGKGRVKVIDFGIARATNSDLALTTVQTEVGQLLGTLQYMSPEQCEADPDKLDIRSDVYALGVVLYELLCDALPYDVRHAAVFEAARLIQEEPPMRPSTANRTLRGDVETIVLKALEKERRRRYQTVSAFETDIRRYLRGEVILARRAGPGRRLAKFVRRNPVLSSAVVVAFLCLAGFLVYVAFWSYPRLQEEKAKLEAEAGNTRQVNDFLREMLSWANPFKEGREVPVTEMLDRAADRIDQEFPDRPGIEAALRHTLGITYRSNGRYEEAMEQLLRARELYQGLGAGTTEAALVLEGDLAELRYSFRSLEAAEESLLDYLDRAPGVLGPDHPSVLEASSNLARLYQVLGRYEESERIFLKCIADQERVLGEDHPDAISSRGSLAVLYQRMSRFDEARTVHQETVDAWRRSKGDEHLQTLAARHRQAGLYQDLGLYQEAIPLREETLEASRRTLGDEHPTTLRMLTQLADCYSKMGRYEEAEVLLRESFEGLGRALGPENVDTIIAGGALACCLGKLGRAEEAETLFLEGLAISQRIFGDDHRATLTKLNNLAAFYYDLGRDAEAEPLLVEALERDRRVLGDDHNSTLTAVNNLGGLYWRQGRYEEAEPLLLEALEGKRRILGDDSMSTLTTLNNLASLYMMEDRLDEAEVRFDQALESLERSFGGDHPNTLSLKANLAGLYWRQGRHDEGEVMYIEAIEGLRESLGDDHWLYLDTRTQLGRLYTDLARFAEAESIHVETLARLRDTMGSDNSMTLYSLQQLVDLYDCQQRYADAEPLARELIELTPENDPDLPERKALLERILRRGGG